MITGKSGKSSNIFELKAPFDENIAGAVSFIVGQPLNHKEIHVRRAPHLIADRNITEYRIYYTEAGVDMNIKWKMGCLACKLKQIKFKC